MRVLDATPLWRGELQIVPLLWKRPHRRAPPAHSKFTPATKSTPPAENVVVEVRAPDPPPPGRCGGRGDAVNQG